LGSVLAGSGEEVLIHNLSVTGFLIETSAELTCGEALEVDLPEGGPTPASVVWQRNGLYGCEFAVRVPAALVSAAVLRNPAFPVRNRAATGEDDQEKPFSSRVRVLVIFGLSAALWALVGIAVLSLV
jgi:hypothetical protein